MCGLLEVWAGQERERGELLPHENNSFGASQSFMGFFFFLLLGPRPQWENRWFLSRYSTNNQKIEKQIFQNIVKCLPKLKKRKTGTLTSKLTINQEEKKSN